MLSRRIPLAPIFAGLLALAPPVAAQHDDVHHHDNAHHEDDATAHHRFENAAEWAEVFEAPERDRWQLPGQVVETLVQREDLVILDLGSATGYFAVRFAAAAPKGRVYGADIEPDMVFYLNDRALQLGVTNLTSILCEAADPHLPQPVDLVFICNTYHHIDNRLEYFERLKSALSPGAQVAVVDFKPESELGPPHKLDPTIVEHEMTETGYTLLGRYAFLPEQYFLVFGLDTGASDPAKPKP